ncbi:MAG TPA: EAL domain-containing protein [Vicinamibacteria bacterium]|nr:EAL domain-containing protein [Vicinamibacteria bacterium]
MSTGAAAGRDYFRLRAEWLRFKNNVFDANTELPTLAAVLDDVRRLVEDRGAVGLVYLDLGGDPQVEAYHGWLAYDELLRTFVRKLEGLTAEGLLSPRDRIAAVSVRSDKFLVFLGGTSGAPLDLPAVSALAARLRERLTTALAGYTALPATFHDGHALLQRDPMARTERLIHRALDEAMLMSLRRRSSEEDRRAQGLDALIRSGQVSTFFQPIVDLRSREVIGHEVFNRGPAGGPFEDADGLFALAERTGRLVDFERLCRSRSIGGARRHLHAGQKLFLNTSARALSDSDVAGRGFVSLVEHEGLAHGDVVLEINERMASEARTDYGTVLRDLKHEGFRLAIDDMGAGYSSLNAVVEMEPDYVKFDVSLVRNIDRSLIKRSLLETLVELAAKIHAEVIAEGIEGAHELDAVREMGVRFGQGRFLAAPAPVPAA